jgi:hypothetical protein
MMLNKSLRNPAFGLQLRKFFRTTSSIVEGNISQTAKLNTLTLIQSKSVITSQAGTITLSLALRIVDTANSVVQRIPTKA